LYANKISSILLRVVYGRTCVSDRVDRLVSEKPTYELN
jgi:hypothetical protein